MIKINKNKIVDDCKSYMLYMTQSEKSKYITMKKKIRVGNIIPILRDTLTL